MTVNTQRDQLEASTEVAATPRPTLRIRIVDILAFTVLLAVLNACLVWGARASRAGLASVAAEADFRIMLVLFVGNAFYVLLFLAIHVLHWRANLRRWKRGKSVVRAAPSLVPFGFGMAPAVMIILGGGTPNSMDAETILLKSLVMAGFVAISAILTVLTLPKHPSDHASWSPSNSGSGTSRAH